MWMRQGGCVDVERFQMVRIRRRLLRRLRRCVISSLDMSGILRCLQEVVLAIASNYSIVQLHFNPYQLQRPIAS